MKPESKIYAIGIDLGGSSIKAVTVTQNGDTHAHANLSFDTSTPMDWARKIRDLVNGIQEEVGKPARGIGLSAPGLVAEDGLSITCMPGRLQGLERLNWTEFLGIKRTVPVLNDAHAALIGETWIGAGRGCRNVIMLTLGTGVGGAAIVDGRLLRGHIGRAGHLGHASLDIHGPPDICKMPGSLEVAIGNCTIEERTGGRFTSTHDLIAAHKQGDPLATEVWLKSVKALACAIGSFVNILDPEAVIVGGGIGRAGKSLFEPLQQFLDAVEWQPNGHRVKVLPAQLGEFAGAIGAAGNAFRESGLKTSGGLRVEMVPYVRKAD